MGVVVRNAYHFDVTEKGETDVVYLVSNSWPRGIRKEDIGVDEWLKSLMPSRHIAGLMHNADEWQTFLGAYATELAGNRAWCRNISDNAAAGQVFLLHTSRSEHYNPAQALKIVLEGHL